MSYCILWQFEAAPSRLVEFESAYGPRGAWAQLFRRSSGFIDVRLLRSCERPDTYFTIDHWVSVEAFQEFRRDFAAEYGALDRRCEGLTKSEIRLDALTEIG
jgi:heme-degrading monooxygenase HmoA